MGAHPTDHSLGAIHCCILLQVAIGLHYSINFWDSKAISSILKHAGKMSSESRWRLL